MSELLFDRPIAPEAPEAARGFTRSLVSAADGSMAAVILYGSQLHRSSPNQHSAWDLVVVADDLRAFHKAMHSAGYQQRAPWKMNALIPLLPPYVTAFAPPDMGGMIAKCLVMTLKQFMAALAPNATDHFLKGRMVQHVEPLWSRSVEVDEQVRGALREAREDVLRWAGPFMPESFDAAELTQGMLTVSFAGELRPEGKGRSMEVWESQADWLIREYTELLDEQVAAGRLRRVEDGGADAAVAGAPDALPRYAFVNRPSSRRRARINRYFTWSKVRGTARWAKHIVTFNDWLTYVQRKAERRTGLEIEITPAERKWPLIFLWPKVVRVLRYSRTGELPPGGKL